MNKIDCDNIDWKSINKDWDDNYNPVTQIRHECQEVIAKNTEQLLEYITELKAEISTLITSNENIKQISIIFLDIDGVLNTIDGGKSSYLRHGKHMEEELVQNLNDFLVENAYINIVISSSWRDDMDDLKFQLESNGFLFWDRVIGRTNLFDEFRGEQIKEFLECHNEYSNYIVIDDNMKDICGEYCNLISKDRCIEIDSKIGLSKDKINETILILNSF